MADKLVIHFVITGGTIDSYYEGSKDTVVPNKKSIIPEFIGSLKLYCETTFSEVCMKDSRELTLEDLNNVLQTIETSPHNKLIVTHGTYTMPDTARFIKSNIKHKEKTVILTASAIPINGFAPSDGPFNLGYAIAEAQHLPAGVYVAMNGKIFFPEEIIKVISQGRFASIFGESE
jgi:L-asparaginase